MMKWYTVDEISFRKGILDLHHFHLQVFSLDSAVKFFTTVGLFPHCYFWSPPFLLSEEKGDHRLEGYSFTFDFISFCSILFSGFHCRLVFYVHMSSWISSPRANLHDFC